MPDYPGFDGSGAADPFSKMWFDMMSKFAPTAGFAPQQAAANPSEQVLKQFRQAFFDAWAKHCEEFMRSDQFLQMMKKGMDSALAFRTQLNEFMTKALHENQMPARSDTDSILLVLRSMEERVLDRIERLSQRVDALETRGVSAGGPTASTAAPETKRRPKEATR